MQCFFRKSKVSNGRGSEGVIERKEIKSSLNSGIETPSFCLQKQSAFQSHWGAGWDSDGVFGTDPRQAHLVPTLS